MGFFYKDPLPHAIDPTLPMTAEEIETVFNYFPGSKGIIKTFDGRIYLLLKDWEAFHARFPTMPEKLGGLEVELIDCEMEGYFTPFRIVEMFRTFVEMFWCFRGGHEAPSDSPSAEDIGLIYNQVLKARVSCVEAKQDANHGKDRTGLTASHAVAVGELVMRRDVKEKMFARKRRRMETKVEFTRALLWRAREGCQDKMYRTIFSTEEAQVEEQLP